MMFRAAAALLLFLALSASTTNARELQHTKVDKGKINRENSPKFEKASNCAHADQYIVTGQGTRRRRLARTNGLDELRRLEHSNGLSELRQAILDCEGASIRTECSILFSGFIVDGMKDACVDKLLERDDVISIEENGEVQGQGEATNGLHLDQSIQVGDATNALPWGIDRLDQPGPSLDNQYKYNGDGNRVDVYVFDSGIKADHDDFFDPGIVLTERYVPAHGSGMFRTSCLVDFYEGEGGNCVDIRGHGTHVAATIGGLYSGVAKDVHLISVKMLRQSDGKGTVSDMVEALELIAASRPVDAGVVAIINMSLSTTSSGQSQILNTAVDAAALEDGLLVIAAAGAKEATKDSAGGGDSCTKSPASSSSSIGVASTTKDDARADWSFSGACVDIFAPGQDILSASVTGTTATEERTGTSMSAAHVSGIAALYVQKYPELTVTELKDKIMADAMQGVVTDAPSTKNNHLASTMAISGVELQCLAKNSVCDHSAQCCGNGLFCHLEDKSDNPSGRIPTNPTRTCGIKL
jgi:hypothetical protein